MTDPGNPTAQQRRLAELPARRPKAKRRHPARASRIAVLGLSTTAMFGIVAKLGVDANSQTVATTGTPSRWQVCSTACTWAGVAGRATTSGRWR